MSIPFMVIFVCAWYFKMLIPMLIWCVMFLMLRNYIGGLLLINIFTEPVIHDENLKGYKRNYCKIGVVILAGGVVCAVFLNLCNVKLGNAVFMGIISAEFLYGIDLLINGKKIKLYNERNQEKNENEKISWNNFFNIWFLEIIVLSAISTFDRVMYEDTNHFIGFINNYGLWPFLIGSVIVLFCGVVLIVLEYSKKQ